jgi:hypothetical protein
MATIVSAYVHDTTSRSYGNTFYYFSGYLRDTSGSYDNTFYFSSVFIILAGFLLITVPIYTFLKHRCLCRVRSRQRQNNTDLENEVDNVHVKFLNREIEISV